MANHYTPPEQSGFMQLIDASVILALVFFALFSPLIFGLAGGGKVDIMFKDATGVEKPWADLAATEKTWSTLGQNAVQQAQWEKLGATPDSAAPMIASRYDYTFSPMMLIVTAIVVIGYFWLLFILSKAEYREVIAEKFGNK